MADEAKKRAEILMMAKAQGKTLRPEHEAELEKYQEMGIIPSPEGKTRPMSDGSAKAYEEQVGIYAALKNSVGGFQDAYAGNTVTGGLENTAQSLNSNIGTPGQRDWWSNFRASDNMIRNSLFGSALTDTEKKAYEETTISERMDPEIIKQNLDRRKEIVRKALARKSEFLKKNRVDPDAVDALAGEYAPEFSADYKPVKAGDKGSMEFNDSIPTPVGARLTDEQQKAFTDFVLANKAVMTPELLSSWQNAHGMEPIANLEEYVKGVRESTEPVTQMDYSKSDELAKQQARERLGAVNNAGTATVAGVGDALTFGLRDKAIAAGKSVFNDKSYSENLQNTRADAAVMEEDHLPATIVGNVAGLIAGGRGAARAFPKTAEFMNAGSKTAQLGKSVAGDAAYSGVYGYNKSDNDPIAAASAATMGAAGSAGGQVLAKGAGRILNPAGNAAVDLLRSKGVSVTPGQALGPAAARIEEKLQSVPIVGDLIRGARDNAEKGFNAAVINDALAPLGKKLPEGYTGKKAMKFAQDAFNDAYGNARSGMRVVPDDELKDAYTEFAQRLADGEVSEGTAKRIGQIFEAQVARHLDKGEVSGKAYKEMHSRIGKMMDAAKRRQDDELYTGLNEMQSILDASARKHSPAQYVKAMDQADEGYSQFVRVENAAKMRGGETGEFSASQYDSAVQKGDSSVRSKAYLRGEALGQDMAEAGKSILRDSVPNSGTADRLMMGALGAGAVGGASYLDPTGIAPYAAGGLAALYLPGVRGAAVKAITGKRPVEFKRLGDIMINQSRVAGAIGTGAGLPSLTLGD